ncbi:MAG: hypothetical protein COB04_01825 [Gammaproteobacteria bacterium]|nr:MAG: hypothetical protein COB04_01825 [Gammaproteobacteria bacterium]
MKPKKYFASDMSSAIKLIREDLGPEAIILSNRKVSGGVEIVSALDNLDEILSRELPNAVPSVKSKAKLRARASDESRRDAPELSNPSVGKSAEINSINDRRFAKAGRSSNTSGARNRAPHATVKGLGTMKNSRPASGNRSRQSQRTSNATNASASSALHAKSAFDYYHDVAEQREQPVTDEFNELDSDQVTAQQSNDAEPLIPEDGSDAFRKMRGEVLFLRKLLEQQNQGDLVSEVTGSPPSVNGAVDAIRLKLECLGFSPWHLDRTFERLITPASSSDRYLQEGRNQNHSDNAPNLLRAVLDDLIRDVSLMKHDIVATGGCVIVVGPPGAGKTTTLAKLATRRVLERGPQSVRIISLDSHRIGASQQIKAIGELLNVEVKIQYDVGFFSPVMPQYADPNVLTLIDTAGMLPQDEHWIKQLNQLKMLPDFVKKMLVIPCSSQFLTLQSVIKNFSDIGLSGCILTKLDETSSMGVSLSALLQSGLEICYVSNGQKIPFDLFQFDHDALLNLLKEQVDGLCSNDITSRINNGINGSGDRTEKRAGQGLGNSSGKVGALLRRDSL